MNNNNQHRKEGKLLKFYKKPGGAEKRLIESEGEKEQRVTGEKVLQAA